jgi:hypothetical protein
VIFEVLAEKSLRGGMWFLLGIFAFLWCLYVVNRGEVVVECVANVVCCRPLFRGLKMGHLFQLYFMGRRSGQIGNDEAA